MKAKEIDAIAQQLLAADPDTPERMRLLRDVLTASGHYVMEAADGHEGLRRYRPSQTDLVISDVLMPGKTGLELVGELRQIHPEARVIVCGSTGEAELSRARTLGALRTFEKPFSVFKVLEAVEELLGKAKTHSTAGGRIGNEATGGSE